jgi:malate permease and related proteins
MAPSMLLACIGLGWKKSGLEYPTNFVTTLVINIALPALIFHTLVSADISLDALYQLGSATVVVHVLLISLSALVLRLAKKDLGLTVSFTVGNTGNLGLPLCLLAFGEEGLAYAIVYFSVQCIFLFTVGEAVYAGSLSIKRILKVPIIYALIAALLVRIGNIPVHEIIMDTTQLLGGVVVPIMLITLGISIAGMVARNFLSTLFWALVRTGLAIIAGLLVAEWFSLEGVARGVLIIETVVPVAVFHYLLAYKHNKNSEEISGLILITHLAAILYFPFIFGLVL